MTRFGDVTSTWINKELPLGTPPEYRNCGIPGFHVKKIPTKLGKRYYYRQRIGSGSWKTLGNNLELDLETAFEIALNNYKNRNIYKHNYQVLPIFKEWLEEHVRALSLSESTKKHLNSVERALNKSDFGKLCIRKITVSLIRDFLIQTSNSIFTKCFTMRCLINAFNYFVMLYNEEIPELPHIITYEKSLKFEKNQIAARSRGLIMPNVHDVQEAINFAILKKPEYAIIIELCYCTGLRISEVLNISPENTNFLNHITSPKTKTEKSGVVRVYLTPKTEELIKALWAFKKYYQVKHPNIQDIGKVIVVNFCVFKFNL